jgi:hypothetical protein
MKKILFLLLFPVLFSCSDKDPIPEMPLEAMIQGEEPSAFTCINSQADNPPTLENAKKWIIGKWQLKSKITMIPNAQVPNYQIEFKEDGGVFVTLVGVSVYTDAYSLVENVENNYRSIKMVTDNLMDFSNEHNIVKGTIRVCEKELMLDQGIAFDAPGFLFRKLE